MRFYENKIRYYTFKKNNNILTGLINAADESLHDEANDKAHTKKVLVLHSILSSLKPI